MPCPMGDAKHLEDKPLYSIGAGIYPAQECDFVNSLVRSGKPNPVDYEIF